MYNSIHMSIPETDDSDIIMIESAAERYFSEAVFNKGKDKVKSLEDRIKTIKDELDKEIDNQENKVKDFDPTKFWRSQAFKDFEDDIKKIFGFRHVEIQPYQEKYLSKDKMFESKELNCFVYNADRYPIEGLLTDDGFYDKTHSLIMQIYFSLGLLRELNSEEMLAIFLHEFGHSIDPALVDIKYTETNVLSKYITDRKHAITPDETKVMNKFSAMLSDVGDKISQAFLGFATICHGAFLDIFRTKEKAAEHKLEKINKKLKSDKHEFNRQNYAEAFADNFARMYGYGSQVMKALSKVDSAMDKEVNTRYKKEKARQDIIYKITMAMLGDSHKTDIHRIRALIKEYKEDIENPITPAPVKKQLEADLKELEEVLDQYLNHKDDFRKRVNNLINDSITKIEEENSKKDNKDNKDNKVKDYDDDDDD